MTKISSVLNTVKAMLTEYPHLRDDDQKLMANIWYKTICYEYMDDAGALSAFDLLQMLSDGKFPSYESISRCRRKLQEEFPDLRGEKYEDRHAYQKEIINDLRSIGGSSNGNVSQ